MSKHEPLPDHDDADDQPDRQDDRDYPATSDDAEPTTPPEGRERPDWLLGADAAVTEVEGLERRTVSQAFGAPAPDGLVRRERPRAVDPSQAAGGAASTEASDKPTLRAWSAKASSIPQLKRTTAEPEPLEIEPEYESEDEPAPAPTALERLIELNARPAATPRAALKTAPEAAWWQHALTAVFVERRVQIALGVVGVMALVAISSMGVRKATTASLADMHRNPSRYDGTVVTVDGRVGEVFEIAGGYAFFLHQGRDTIVAYAKTFTPVPRRNVSFRGEVSTGFMDGAPRQALFEVPPEDPKASQAD